MAVLTGAPASSPPPAPAAPAPSGSVPARLRTLLAALVAACLAWGGLATWTVVEHASAAGRVVSTSEPLSLTAQQMYQDLSNADVTATSAFLAGPREPLGARLRYTADVTRAASDLAELKAAAGTSPALARDLGAIATGLPAYTGDVASAQAQYALGYRLPAGSLMQVATEEMHLTLLPAAGRAYAQENARLRADSAQATGLPWIIVVLVAALLIGFALIRSQRWLTRRTHRVISPGLLLATVALLAGIVWLAVSFLVARSDLGRGTGHGSAPAETLAQAGIDAAQARGDEILNLISRSGDTTFEQNFTAERKQLGPGSGTLLSRAAAASPGGAGARWTAAAGKDATVWYGVDQRVARLDGAANYAAETKLVIGPEKGGSAARFSSLESDLSRAIAADQVVFSRSAAAGRDAYGGLDVGVIVIALLMAAGCAWGLARRLAEYR